MQLICVRLLGWAGNLPTSQQTLSVAIVNKHIKETGSLIQQVRIYSVNPGRTVCLHSCGLPVVSLTRPTGAQVFALFPRGVCRGASGTPAFLLPALSHCTRQTAPGTSRHRQRVSDCSGGQLRCPLRIRHGARKTTLFLRFHSL